jgi:hypothetical protein
MLGLNVVVVPELALPIPLGAECQARNVMLK